MSLKHKKTKPTYRDIISNIFRKIMPSFLFNDNEEEEIETIIVSNVDDFSEKIVEDVMVPRSDIVAINENASLEELQKMIVEHGHTRILVYKDNMDNIIGFIHIKDLFEIITDDKKFNLRNLVRKHLNSPHSMKLADLLRKMQHTRTHISVVVDEYGGTDGLVTIEDIIEEIVGEIDDEHDTEKSEEEDVNLIEPGVIIANARVEIELIEEMIGYSISSEEDEIDTIGGLVMSLTGKVPSKGEKFSLRENVQAEVMESTPRMIKRLKITYQDEE